MGAGTIALRLGDLLVGVAVDTLETLERCRTEFAEWIDDDRTDITPALDLRLAQTSVDEGGVRSVPQLRLGASVVARSRSADDVVAALDSILGGIKAQRTEPDRIWVFLRAFARNERVALVDARAPMLVNDPVLERAGVAELPTWAVAVAEPDDGTHAVLDVPASLTGRLPGRHCELVGLVALGHPDVGVGDDGAGAVLARYGARHTSPVWFRALNALLDEGRLALPTDRVAARTTIGRLLA